jgi:hypothetical protein
MEVSVAFHTCRTITFNQQSHHNIAPSSMQYAVTVINKKDVFIFGIRREYVPNLTYEV